MHPAGGGRIVSGVVGSGDGAADVAPRAAREAARWMVRLQAGGMGAADLERCARWRARDPENEQAWQRAELVMRKMGMVPSALGAPVLRRSASRRATLKTLLLLAGAGPLGWAAWRAAPWDEWRAGHMTAAGERQELALADGSSVILNTDTALEVRFDGTARRLLLRKGEILVQTAPDPVGRHFIVDSPHGAMRALGTRFTVRLDGGGHTALEVLEGAVEVSPASGAARYVVRAGSQSRFGKHGGTVQALDLNAAAWVDGVLYAERMPLPEFVAELARYRRGVLRCDPALAGLEVSGAFQLRDTDAVLRALAASLPVKVRTRTRFWVTLAPR
jgi:transmembrane sensor